MARPLSYPFNTLEKVGDWFESEPAAAKYGKRVGLIDGLLEARIKANRYANKHFGDDKITVNFATESLMSVTYRFERVAG